MLQSHACYTRHVPVNTSTNTSTSTSTDTSTHLHCAQILSTLQHPSMHNNADPFSVKQEPVGFPFTPLRNAPSHTHLDVAIPPANPVRASTAKNTMGSLSEDSVKNPTVANIPSMLMNRTQNESRHHNAHVTVRRESLYNATSLLPNETIISTHERMPRHVANLFRNLSLLMSIIYWLGNCDVHAFALSNSIVFDILVCIFLNMNTFADLYVRISQTPTWWAANFPEPPSIGKRSAWSYLWPSSHGMCSYCQLESKTLVLHEPSKVHVCRICIQLPTFELKSLPEAIRMYPIHKSSAATLLRKLPALVDRTGYYFWIPHLEWAASRATHGRSSQSNSSQPSVCSTQRSDESLGYILCSDTKSDALTDNHHPPYFNSSTSNGSTADVSV